MRFVRRLAIVSVLGIVVLAAAGARAAGPHLDLSAAKVVDLTHSFDEKTLYWPKQGGTGRAPMPRTCGC